MLTFEAANMGVRYMLTRLSMSIVGILLIAVLTDRLLTKADREDVYARNAE